MTIESARSERLNMRISPDALALVRRAAARQQQDLSGFVLGAAMDRARRVLFEDRFRLLSPEAMAQLEQELAKEPEAIPELAELFRSVREARAS
jgi:uncharacterized protein (DUF1778 family)